MKQAFGDPRGGGRFLSDRRVSCGGEKKGEVEGKQRSREDQRIPGPKELFTVSGQSSAGKLKNLNQKPDAKRTAIKNKKKNQHREIKRCFHHHSQGGGTVRRGERPRRNASARKFTKKETSFMDEINLGSEKGTL